MRHLVEKTGGYMVNHEAFAGGVQGDVFVQSLMKMFTPDPATGHLNFGFGAKLDIVTSRHAPSCAHLRTMYCIPCCGVSERSVWLRWRRDGMCVWCSLSAVRLVIPKCVRLRGESVWPWDASAVSEPQSVGSHSERGPLKKK